MQIIAGTTQIQLQEPSAVAIGKFDGIHLGHMELLEQILGQKANGMKAVVFTFDPSPAELFTGKKELELTTKQEKRKLFEQMGIDILIEFPLTFESAAIPAEEFIEKILYKQLKTAYIAAGTDLSFGKDGKGNSELLCQNAKKYHFIVKIISKILYNGKEISSTMVRNEVAAGSFKQVTKMLGKEYQISGRIVHGQKIGRTIGFPTINIYPEERKLLPPNGVYKTKVLLDGKIYDAISNVGCKPTVTTDGRILLESYLYDFNKDVYGEEAIVFFKQFMRPEKKFDSLDDLKQQLKHDMENGRITD